MNCIKCGTVINPLRLKALPGTKVCVNCSTTAPIYARPIISGKTTYSELEIIKDPVAKDAVSKFIVVVEDVTVGAKFAASRYFIKVTMRTNLQLFKSFFDVTRFAAIIKAVKFEFKLLILTVGLGNFDFVAEY